MPSPATPKPQGWAEQIGTNECFRVAFNVAPLCYLIVLDSCFECGFCISLTHRFPFILFMSQVVSQVVSQVCRKLCREFVASCVVNLSQVHSMPSLSR